VSELETPVGNPADDWTTLEGVDRALYLATIVETNGGEIEPIHDVYRAHGVPIRIRSELERQGYAIVPVAERDAAVARVAELEGRLTAIDDAARRSGTRSSLATFHGDMCTCEACMPDPEFQARRKAHREAWEVSTDD